MRALLAGGPVDVWTGVARTKVLIRLSDKAFPTETAPVASGAEPGRGKGSSNRWHDRCDRHAEDIGHRERRRSRHQPRDPETTRRRRSRSSADWFPIIKTAWCRPGRLFMALGGWCRGVGVKTMTIASTYLPWLWWYNESFTEWAVPALPPTPGWVCSPWRSP